MSAAAFVLCGPQLETDYVPSARRGSISRLGSRLLLPAILFAYLADVLFGVTSLWGVDVKLQLGPVIRGGVLAIAIAVLLVRSRWSPHSVVGLVFISGVVLWSVARGLQWQWNATLVSSEILWLFKLAYAPLVLLALLDAEVHGWITQVAIRRVILSAAVILSLLVLIPAMFGVGHGTYVWGVGSTGFLTAQNDVGLAMAIFVPALVLFVRQGSLIALGVVALVISAALLIGTRTGVLAPFALAAAMVVVLLYAEIRNMAGHQRGRMMPLVVTGAVVTLAAGSVGVWVSVVSDHSPKQIEKLYSTIEGNTNRGRMAGAAQEIVFADQTALWTIGQGRARTQEQLALVLGEPRRLRPVEVDWIDLVAGFGLPVAMVMALMICVGLGSGFIAWVISGSPALGMSLLSLGAWLGHGLLAGHALASPLPATSLVLVAGWGLAMWRLGVRR